MGLFYVSYLNGFILCKGFWWQFGCVILGVYFVLGYVMSSRLNINDTTFEQKMFVCIF